MAHPFESSRTPKKFVGRGLNLKASRLSRFFSPFAGEGNGRVTAQGPPAAGDVPGRTCSSISEDTRRIADELFASSTLLGWGEGYTPSSVRLGTEMLERSNKPSRRVGSSSPGTEGSNLLPSSGESRANLRRVPSWLQKEPPAGGSLPAFLRHRSSSKPSSIGRRINQHLGE